RARIAVVADEGRRRHATAPDAALDAVAEIAVGALHVADARGDRARRRDREHTCDETTDVRGGHRGTSGDAVGTGPHMTTSRPRLSSAGRADEAAADGLVLKSDFRGTEN